MKSFLRKNVLNAFVIATVICNCAMIYNNRRMNDRLQQRYDEFGKEYEAMQLLRSTHQEWLLTMMRIDARRIAAPAPVMRVPNRVPVPDPALFPKDAKEFHDAWNAPEVWNDRGELIPLDRCLPKGRGQ